MGRTYETDGPHPQTHRVVDPCEPVNKQRSARTLASLVRRKMGPKEGRPRPGWEARDPSRGRPGFGASAPGSRAHSHDTVFPAAPSTPRPPPARPQLLSSAPCPPPRSREGKFPGARSPAPDPRRGYLLQKRDKGQGTGEGAARRRGGRGPGEEGGRRRRRRRLSAGVLCSQRCHYCGPRPPPRRPRPSGPERGGAQSAPRRLTCRRGQRREVRGRRRSRLGRASAGHGLATAPPHPLRAPFRGPQLRGAVVESAYGKRREPGLVRSRTAAEIRPEGRRAGRIVNRRAGAPAESGGS